jgi:arsenical pump membrane protein
MSASGSQIATWLIAASAIAGVIIRPWKLPEAWWAVLGAAAMVVFALLSPPAAWLAIRKGTDVYLFLTGMMLLSELARHEGLFDWLAAFAVQRAKGSASRLFGLVYVVGTVVTIFLSNDATAVVLTPAVYAAAMRAKVEPLPYLLVCAFVANGASFVLPISNPANLVVYGGYIPALGRWLAEFGFASVSSVLVTFLALRFTQRAALFAPISERAGVPTLSLGGRLAAFGIGCTAIVLLLASGLDWQLGLPTFLAGLVTTVAILVIRKISPWEIARDISWSVLPLVAGLFVLVEAIQGSGALVPLMRRLPQAAAAAPDATALTAGAVVALACNLVNNLPLGLIAGAVATGAHLTPQITGALLIGIDLGPNLSVTGSLATILWLVALRREGQSVSAWSFLKLGSVVMPLALLASLAAFLWLKVA